ncbi:MAG: peptidylprolyl isomerase [Verrucomicrobia bacterium]|nr:peptidylprolyl isomerase [Verrucomicrobiota bacterium]
MKDIRVIIQTGKGAIEATLYPSKTPVTVSNFLNLASRGYYEGLKFHRVVPRFVIQAGDPMGTGAGGPGYRFENEINSTLSHNTPGVLAMANAGPDTNGSQFYITIDYLAAGHVNMLDGKYSIFGEVKSGLEVAKSIAQGDRIESIQILDSPAEVFADQKQRLTEWNKILDGKFGKKLKPAG